MAWFNPFLSYAHCLRFARRRAALDGDTFHVVATGLVEAPRRVFAGRDLFAQADLGPDAVEASVDPFAEASVGPDDA